MTSSGHFMHNAKKFFLFFIGDLPDIIVGTPSRIRAHLKEGHIDLSESLETLVIDEADLIFSFGHEADLKAILSSNLPSTYQVITKSS